MIPSDRVLDKLDSLLRANDYAGAKRTLLYWLDEAKYDRDDRGILLILNELMGLCRKLEGNKGNNVAEAVREVVGAVGHQRYRAEQRADDDFTKRQQNVDGAANQACQLAEALALFCNFCHKRLLCQKILLYAIIQQMQKNVNGGEGK